MLSDLHIHTKFSCDSTTEPESAVRAALALGLEQITFAEHINYGMADQAPCDLAQYWPCMTALREKYAGKIKLRIGIELGVQRETIAQAQRNFNAYPFDFVLFSNHQIDNKEFWNQDYQRGKSQSEYQHAYYQAIYDCICRYNGYSVLAHLDMIKRYDEAGLYPDALVMDQVDAILRHVIAAGKGIELNTSCYRYGLSDLTPSRAILARYRELGGECITIGSDAHTAAQIGTKVREAQAALAALGFRYHCTFTNGKAVYHKLV